MIYTIMMSENALLDIYYQCNTDDDGDDDGDDDNDWWWVWWW